MNNPYQHCRIDTRIWDTSLSGDARVRDFARRLRARWRWGCMARARRAARNTGKVQ